MPDAVTDKEGQSELPDRAFAKASEQVRIRTDRYRQLYANNMSINISTWDIGITFGEIVGEQDGKAVIEETTKILMTREVAKILAALLSKNLALFEQDFGPIRIPVVDEPAKESPGKGGGGDKPPTTMPAG